MRFGITVLGTNGAVPSAGRYASAHLFQSELTDLLIDCGEGTQMRLMAAGAGAGRISKILITHLHGDHYFGLPGLITSLALNDRSAPLTIVSPPGLRAKLAPLLDLDRYRLPFDLHFREHHAEEPAVLFREDGIEVSAFPLRHRVPANGYVIREAPRAPNLRKDLIERYAIPYTALPAIKSGEDYVTPGGERLRHAMLTTPAPPPRAYAYCSDTIYFPELAGYVRGVDLLYHEATFLSDMAEEARAKGHATAREAALTARSAGVRRLVMGHFSARYGDLSDHEREAREVFPASFVARDLYRFVVPYVHRDARSAESEP